MTESGGRSRWVSGGVCVVVLVTYVALILIAGSWHGPRVEVDARLDLKMGFDCDEVGTSRFSDMYKGIALVVDAKGNKLGEGRLDEGTQIGQTCSFRSKFTIDESPDGVYRVQLGDADRGYYNFLEEDVVSGRLVVDLMCCVAESDGGAAIPADGCARRDDDNDGIADSQGVC